MVNRQIIILKESELIELIKSSVKELQTEQFLVSPIFTTTPILPSSTVTMLGTSNPITWANISNLVTRVGNFSGRITGQAIRGGSNISRYAFKGPGGSNPLGAMAIGPCSGLEVSGQPVDPDGCASLTDVANFIYKYFIECEGFNECLRRGLDGIAIVFAFVPGFGQIISIVAGLSSGILAIADGEYGEATFSIVFELFPITRMIKRSAAVNMGVKELDNVFTALSKKELTQETVEQLSKELTQKELKFIQQIANQDLKALDKEIAQAINNPANKKMIDDILGIKWDDVSQLSGLNMTQKQFQDIQQALITQTKQMGKYDDIMKNLKTFKNELKFVGIGVGTAMISQIMVELGMSYFVDELTEEQQLELEALTGIDREELMEEAKRNPEMWECFYNNALEAMIEGCSPAFQKWLKDSWLYSENMTYEELWDRWTKARDKETLKEEIQGILNYYWKKETQEECRQKTWEKVKQCRKGINSIIENLK